MWHLFDGNFISVNWSFKLMNELQIESVIRIAQGQLINALFY